MKKIIFTFCLLMAAMFLTAQDVPQAINFQAIARDANSEVLANTPIMIQLTILDGSPDGAQVYREIRSLTTNAYGSFSFQIGRDPYMSDGNFADIDWAGSRKFLKIDYDPTATLSFDLSLGTIEFVSVPYAFAAGAVSYIDASGAADGDVLAYNATTGRFEPVAMSIPDFEESDPTVPTWAKAETKPTYNYSEIENTPDLSGYITTESQTIADVAALGNSLNTQLKNVTDPTDAQDAATKKYVDDLIAALQAQNEALQETLSAVICNITFDANGGTGEMAPQTFTIGVAQALTANAFTKGNYPFNGWNTVADGSGTDYANMQEVTVSANVTLYAQWSNHEFVDLGLPSGTRWATCNVGANNPEAYGDYFAWGETTPKDSYTEENYTYSDNPETLPASADADAATANWGEGWRMPTQSEMQELYDNCTHEWTTQNEVNGRLFTGPNGNSIFLPAAGRRLGSELYYAGSFGYYWSSSLDSDYPYLAWRLYFYSDYCYLGSYYPYYGFTVRAVCQSQN